MKRIVIVGSAPCLEEDLRSLDLSGFDFAAVGKNSVYRTSWPLQYVATYHPEDIDAIRKVESDAIIVCHIKDADKVDLVLPYEPPSGSSALLAVEAAIHFGYDKIVLAGCPLVGNSPAGNYDYANFRAGWKSKHNSVKDVVRSLSGWTMDFLGYPTEEWLND